MLRIIFLFLFFIISIAGRSQGGASASSSPPIDLLLTNGQKFTNQNLKSGAFVLIYFSPDCEHCKQFITALLQREKLVRSKQIVMASFVAISTLKEFEEAMVLGKFPNIKIGTEGESYRLARGLGIRKFPFVALYNGTGQLVRTFEGEQPLSEIVAAMESI